MISSSSLCIPLPSTVGPLQTLSSSCSSAHLGPPQQMIQMHSRYNLKTYGLSNCIVQRTSQAEAFCRSCSSCSCSLAFAASRAKSLQLNFDTFSTTSCAFSDSSSAFKRLTTSSACRQNDIKKNDFMLTTVLQTILSLWEVEYHTYRKENYMHVRSPHFKRSTQDHLLLSRTHLSFKFAFFSLQKQRVEKCHSLSQ